MIWLTLPLVVTTAACLLALGFGFDTLVHRFVDERQPLAPLLAYGRWLDRGVRRGPGRRRRRTVVAQDPASARRRYWRSR